MAEPTLSITHDELRREVGHFLGWSRVPGNWDNTQAQDYADISKRALRMFYYPPIGEDVPPYEWTFLRKTGSITTVDAQGDYDLPDDFGGTILDSSTRFAAGTENRQLKKVDEQIIEQKKAIKNKFGVPRYYSARNKDHDAETGQRWELNLFPTPSANTSSDGLVISFRYVFVPDELDPTNIYPVGGGQYSEVVLAAHLAAAEYKQDDDPAGPQMQRFQDMLATAVRNDMQQKTNRRGGGS